MDVVSGLYFDYQELDPLAPVLNLDDLALPPTGVGYRFSPTIGINLSGIVAPADPDTVLLLFVDNLFPLTLLHGSVLSVLGNRFFLPGAASLIIPAYSSRYVRYDATLNGWHAV